MARELDLIVAGLNQPSRNINDNFCLAVRTWFQVIANCNRLPVSIGELYPVSARRWFLQVFVMHVVRNAEEVECLITFAANPKRLHSFWDGILGTSREPAFAITVGQGLPVPSVGAASNLEAREWINESFELAKSTVYRPPIGPGDGPFTMTNNYRNSARALARKRVALGGARLANVLNSELR